MAEVVPGRTTEPGVGAAQDTASSFLVDLLRKQVPWTAFTLDATWPRATTPTPVFVVGSPRSGTTVVGRCLAAHPQLAGVDESLFLIYLYDMFYELHLGLGRHRVTPRCQLPTGTFLTHVADFAAKLLAGWAGGGPRRRIVDDTPWYGAIAPFIDAIMPGCVFVHVVRNGLAVTRSLARSHDDGRTWAGAAVADRAALWSTMVRLCSEIGDHVPPHRFVTLRYEQLCADPVTVLRAVTTRLDLPWEDAVLGPLRLPHATPSRSDWATSGSAAPEVTGWPDHEVAEFAAVAGPTMHRLGYRWDAPTG